MVTRAGQTTIPSLHLYLYVSKYFIQPVMKLEDITARIVPEEGWNDIFLKITDRKENNNSVIYIAQGLYEGNVVGLKVEVRKGMTAGLLSSGEINQDAFYRDGIRFFSIGNESDELVKVLSKLYQFPTTMPFAESITDVMTFSLNEIPVDLNRKEYYKFKLFFHNDYEDLYCEMFCNIGLLDDVIEVHEKDEDYRGNIINTFTN